MQRKLWSQPRDNNRENAIKHVYLLKNLVIYYENICFIHLSLILANRLPANV